MQLNSHGLLRLLQLASPLLPVGAYSYSQGLEWAIEEKTVYDQPSALRWITDTLRYSMGRFEAPIFWRMLNAWGAHDHAAVAEWNDYFCVSRETAELRAETLQMGYSLARLLNELGEFDSARLAILAGIEPMSFPLAFSFAATEWQISSESALHAYLWAWVENQVSAAIKGVPLGQVAGQKILSTAALELPEVVQSAMQMKDNELSNYCPALAIASSRHETQYSRLFRS